MTNENIDQIEVLREAGEHSPDAVVIINREQGRVEFANTVASSLLEINTGDQVKKIAGTFESVLTTDQEYVKSKFHQLDQQPATTDVEFRIMGSDGLPIALNCDAFLIVDKKFVYVIARDVTKAKQHEQYLIEYGARKNTLLDTLIHHLSGSLTLVSNLALKAGKLNVTSDQNALEEFVTLVHNAARHSIDIIEDLLKKEHSESPGIHVKFARTDVVKIVNYVFDELQKTNGSRSMVFETSAPAIYVHTDDMKLLQIVNNFASNAMKFTRRGDEIRLSVRETSTSVLISVADTGIGIPEQLHPFVFEKHGPARRTGLAGEKSIGLGLSICKNLTNLIGGRLWFQSQEGKGTTFFVELPKD